MSIRVTLNCQIKPEKFQDLLPFLRENLPNVRGFLGNTRVSVLFDRANNEMLLDEVWLTKDCHQTYLKFIEENGVLAQLSSFLTASPQIKYFEYIDV